MQSALAFLNILRVADYRWKNHGVGRAQDV